MDILSLTQQKAAGKAGLEGNLESQSLSDGNHNGGFAGAFATALESIDGSVSVGQPGVGVAGIEAPFDLSALIQVPEPGTFIGAGFPDPKIESVSIPVFSRALVQVLMPEAASPLDLSAGLVPASGQAVNVADPLAGNFEPQAPPLQVEFGPPIPLGLADPGAGDDPPNDPLSEQALEAMGLWPNANPQKLDQEPQESETRNLEEVAGSISTGFSAADMGSEKVPSASYAEEVAATQKLDAQTLAAEGILGLGSMRPSALPDGGQSTGEASAKSISLNGVAAIASPVRDEVATSASKQVGDFAAVAAEVQASASLPQDVIAPIVSVKVGTDVAAPTTLKLAPDDLAISEVAVDATDTKVDALSGAEATLGAESAFGKNSDEAMSGDAAGNDAAGTANSGLDLGDSIAPNGSKLEGDRLGFRDALRSADPVTARQLESAQRHQVVRQVADQLEILAATRPREAVVVRLEPQDLGSVTLTLKQLGTVLEANIMASEDRVRQALDQGRSELLAQLNQRGVGLQNLTVSRAENGQNATDSSRQPAQERSQPSANQNQQASRQPYQGSYSGHGSSLTGSGAETSSRRATSATSGGVDIWI